MNCDEIISEKIDPSLCNKNFISLVVASKGFGKTSLATSLICSKKKGCRAYRKMFEDIIVSIPRASLRSIKGDPYKSIPDSNVWPELNEEFLDYVEETAEANSSEGYRTLVLLDDASSKLKSSKSIQDKLELLVHRHRHLRLSFFILIQSLTSVSLGVRKNLDQIFYGKGTNSKSDQIFKEEFLGAYSKDQIDNLFRFVYRERGDFMNLKLTETPTKIFRNFNQVYFNNEKEDSQEEKA